MTRATPSNAVFAAIAGMTGMVLCFVACGSAESGPPVPIDDFAHLIAAAHCDNIGPCCVERGFPHDPDQCRAAAETEMRSDLERSRAKPNLTWDAAAARTCLDAYTAVVKECRDDDDLGDACRYIFAGTLQAGQTCTSSSECVRGTTCQGTADGSATQCATPPARTHGALGDACWATCSERANGSFSCVTATGQGTDEGTATCFINDGFYCDRTNHCAVMPTLGQPCSDAPGFPCAGDAYCNQGNCAARITGSCAANSSSCVLTSYCDAATKQCTPHKATGAACADTLECLGTDACTNGVCRRRSIASESKCSGNL